MNEDLGVKYDFHTLRRDLDRVIPFSAEHLARLNFHEVIFMAFMKADEKHLAQLKNMFPTHSHVWMSYKDPDYFLKNL